MPNAKQMISALGNVPPYSPQKVRQLMKKTGMGVKSFAFVLNVTPATVRRWLVGASLPCNAAKRMMQMLENVPDVLDLLVHGGDEHRG